MIIHNEEVSDLWCPFARIKGEGFNRYAHGVIETPEEARCVGSHCMAWRLAKPDSDDDDFSGYCGLAGKP